MIRIGTTVRLKRHLRKRSLHQGEAAKVQAYIGDIEGGLRLSKSLDGFTMWNIKDVERAPSKRKRVSA